MNGINVAQPIWLSGCPTQGIKQAKIAFFVFFASSPWKSVKVSCVAKMGRNFDDYPGFQPKKPTPNILGGSVLHNFLYEQLNTFPRSLLKFKAKVQQLNTFPRTPLNSKLKFNIYNTFLRTPLKFKVKVHPCPCCMFCVLKFAPLHWCNSAATQQAKYLFRLFPIISISQKFFSFFFLTLEKIGIDEKVICYHNISN